MGVTIVVCGNDECGRMLNGETTNFVGKVPFCNDHYHEAVAEENYNAGYTASGSKE